MPKPVKLIIVGAGNRGRVYADYALRHPDEAQVVAVAEPRSEYRNALARAHELPEKAVYASWAEAAAQEKFADAAVIATPDTLHTGPVHAFAQQGYHLLLEKPMAPTEQECEDVVSTVKRCNVLLAVGHVLRYTPYTQALKRLLAEGAVGEVVSLQHLEPVGYWHQAHSYVRGNWRNLATSSPMLLGEILSRPRLDSLHHG